MDDVRNEVQQLFPRFVGACLVTFCVGFNVQNSQVIKALFLIAAPHSSMSLELLMYFLSLWVVIPFLAFVFMFDVYAGEYEAQTLRTIASILSRRRIFLVKASTRTMATFFAVFFGLFALLPLSFAGFFPFMVWVLCSTLFFSSLMLCVSFFVKKSAHAVILSVLLYVLLASILFTPIAFLSPWSFMSTDPKSSYMMYTILGTILFFGGTYLHFEKRDL